MTRLLILSLLLIQPYRLFAYDEVIGPRAKKNPYAYVKGDTVLNTYRVVSNHVESYSEKGEEIPLKQGDEIWEAHHYINHHKGQDIHVIGYYTLNSKTASKYGHECYVELSALEDVTQEEADRHQRITDRNNAEIWGVLKPVLGVLALAGELDSSCSFPPFAGRKAKPRLSRRSSRVPHCRLSPSREG